MVTPDETPGTSAARERLTLDEIRGAAGNLSPSAIPSPGELVGVVGVITYLLEHGDLPTPAPDPAAEGQAAAGEGVTVEATTPAAEQNQDAEIAALRDQVAALEAQKAAGQATTGGDVIPAPEPPQDAAA